ncbi:GDSL-type esterase/lipase family protein [Motilimonas sp. 1_MG-2023]|uniref:SGNH/GDSL hydrolase family protein n=1 Tax=Motilimonas sp. 1_MG-2023 TaxID=3062672 RepID=UPI0026E2E130|nr:SGNH/GDSL hydrolase family protein [Motilimonas sp. 1_MG-2023]MDO6525260.1 GDSL-type esterase/lipase family protein [Motilimonas sp. 1_MG-2023]
MFKNVATTFLVSLALSGTAQAEITRATDYRLNYEGRSIKDYVTGSVALNWPGSALSFRFTGSKLDFHAKSDGSQFDVLVDGELYRSVKTFKGEGSYNLLNFAEPQDIKVEIVKRTESFGSFFTLNSLDHDGTLSGIWENKPHILFIGDSVTTGYGVESDKLSCTMDEITNTTNGRLSYASITAERLGATKTLVAYSGGGLSRNWAGLEKGYVVPDFLNKAGAVLNDQSAYEGRHVDLVVVNLGGNDFSTPIYPDEPWPDAASFYTSWLADYLTLVENVRARYANVPIVIMAKQRYSDKIADVLELLRTNSISAITPHFYAVIGEGCNVHPTAAQHDVIAEQLVNTIEDLKRLRQ